MTKKEVTADLLAVPIWRLKANGAWPYFAYGEIFLLATLLVLCSEFAYLCTAELDSTLLFRAATEFFGIYLAGLKTWYMYRNAKKVHEVRDFIRSEMEMYETHLPLKSRKTEKRRAAVAKAVCLVIAILTSGLFYMSALLPVFIFFIDGTGNKASTILVGPESIILETDVGFLAFSAIFTLHVYIGVNGVVSFDSLYVMSCHYMSSKSMKLCVMLEELRHQMRNAASPHPLRVEDVLPNFGIDGEKLLPASALNFSGWSGDRHDEEIIYTALVRCVKYHQKIRWLRDTTEGICSFPLLNVMLALVLYLVLPIVQVLLFDVEGPSEYVYFGFYISWSYFNLVQICLWGDQVSEQSEEVASAAFSIYSTGMCSRRIRVALEMMMLRAQRPLYLSAGGLFEISAAKLLAVAKQSWSLMAFILNVRD